MQIAIFLCIISAVMAKFLQKIDDGGRYLPFFGYTAISMVKNLESFEKIEEFIKNSSLANYYAALPFSSYHMTVYNIYSIGSKKSVLPTVKDWIAKGNTLPNKGLLPDHILKNEHDEANSYLNTFFRNESVRDVYKIKSIRLRDPQGARGLSTLVSMDDQGKNVLKGVMEKLGQIYRNHDNRTNVDNLHITLAYRIPKVSLPLLESDPEKFDQFKKDIEGLRDMVNSMQWNLEQPGIYTYQNMMEYIKY